MSNKGVVYVIRNRVNGKLYVGKTVQEFVKYFGDNLVAAINGSTRKTLLYRAIRKHGAVSFETEILASTDSPEMLSQLEKAWILLLGSYRKEIGYNLTMGGDGGAMVGEAYEKLCKPKSDATKKKLSEIAKRRGTKHLNTPEARRKKGVALKGRVFSNETRERMSAAARSRCTPEWRVRQSVISKITIRRSARDGSGKLIRSLHGETTGTERRA